MEQHPVPQNIASFEFRLIGEMTVKQFIFLTVGVGLGYISLQLPLASLIRVPLAAFWAFLGFAFAFLPFQERPLHRWLLAFLKSIYSPTQYLFQKSERPPLYLTPAFPIATKRVEPAFQVAESRRKLEEYLRTLPRTLSSTLDTQETESLKRVQGLLGTLTRLPTPKPAAPIHVVLTHPATPLAIQLKRKLRPKSPEETLRPLTRKKLTFAEGGRLIFEEEKKNIPTAPFKPSEAASRSELLVDEIKRLKTTLAILREKRPSPEVSPLEIADYEKKLVSLERQLEEAEKEREKLVNTVLTLQKEMAVKPQAVAPQGVLEDKSQAVKIVSASAAKAIGLPKLTSTPNVITGVVQDKNGHLLSNVLVEVKDTRSNSVRAFKTNKLGQFASATPLENGTYSIHLEDPRTEFVFDIIEVRVNGSVLPPLAIFAKGQVELNREVIRKSLFGEE